MATAAHIAYPLRRTGQYNRAEAYAAEIQSRADALIDEGDLDTIRNAFDAHEWNSWIINIRVIVHGTSEKSRARAADDIRELVRSGAFKAAEAAYSAEMAESAKQAAIAQHHRILERC